MKCSKRLSPTPKSSKQHTEDAPATRRDYQRLVGDPKAPLRLVYQQNQGSAWAAIAATALFALADGFVR